MPYEFDFDSKNRILRCRFEGRVTDESLKDYSRAAVRYVALTVPRAGILDFSAVTSFEVTPDTILELASSAPTMPDPSHHRFIVAPAPEIFGMARMYQISGEESRPNLHVVHTMQEACAIVGVEEPNFEALQTI